MSWDVMILSKEGTPHVLSNLPPGWKPVPMGDVAIIRDKINRTVKHINWSDPAWGIYDKKGLSIEFNLQKSGQVESFALHIRGKGDPIPIIKSLCELNDWVAVDYSNSTQIDFEADPESGWQRFTKYRDSVIKALRNKSA